jgi:uncharacterized membrane protein YbaN (DUF454 family)
MIRIILIILGSISLVMGIIGIFLPVLPTTPFLLLTAGLYAKSSPVLNKRLSEHKVLGEYIIGFKQGMRTKAKVKAISLMWIMILISAFVFVSNIYLRIFLILVAISVTIYISRLPGRQE